MNKKIIKVNFPEKVGEYQIVLTKFVKFLTNDGSTGYFEEILNEDPTKEQLVEYKLLIVSEDDGFDYIPLTYEYLCSFKDNSHIRYFIYLEDTYNKVFGNFFKNFGNFGLL